MHRTETQINMLKAKAYMRGEECDSTSEDYLAGPMMRQSQHLSSSKQAQLKINQKPIEADDGTQVRLIGSLAMVKEQTSTLKASALTAQNLEQA